jgi:diacylglycerol kinase family enzyme
MLDFIVNPTAGGKNGKKMMKILHKITKHLDGKNVNYQIHIAKELKSSREKTAELIKGGATDIIAVGGDGTLHEVINGFSDFERVNLGIIPCGTGNDFAGAINLPKNPIDALDLILEGEAKYTDFIETPQVRGLNIVSAGIDVDVMKKYNALKRKTKFGYTKCLIKTLMDFEYSDFTVEIDGEKTKYRSFIAGV